MNKKIVAALAGIASVCLLTPAFAQAPHYTIATDTVFKPFEYTDAEGKFVGIDVDILSAIAEDQGFEYDLNSLGWDASIAACQSMQADGMIAGASITDERKENGWIFSDGYYYATQCMTVAADSEIASFADLEGLTVGVKTGTQGASYAESLKEENKFNITYFEDSPTMYQAVLGGQVVACFEDTPIMASSIQDGNLALKIVEGSENEGSPYGFAIFNPEQQGLVDAFNAGLANIVANGKYEEIITNYLGEEAAKSAVASMIPAEEATEEAAEATEEAAEATEEAAEATEEAAEATEATEEATEATEEATEEAK